MRFFRRSSHTRSLTTGSLELAAPRRHRRVLTLGIALLLIAVLAGAGNRYFQAHLETMRRVGELEQENTRLSEDADRARLAMEVEKATRSQLEKQIAELNDQLNRLKGELGFFKSQGSGRR